MNCVGKEMICIDDIFPAFSENNVAIVFESSDYFAPYLDVAMLSLIQTMSPQHNYDIIVLSSELEEQNEVALKELVRGRKNIALRFFNPHAIAKTYIKRARYSYLEINYYRLLLPWILVNYDKVINLGADIVVEHDLADLFQTELSENCYIAGAPDLGYIGRLSIDISPKELGMRDPYKYVNADVLLMNLKAIRAEVDRDWLMSLWQKRQFMCSEQDVLNLAFESHIQHLGLRWNLYPERMNSEYHIRSAPIESVRAWEIAKEDPYIIHYAAVPKPWDSPLVGMGIRWWKYARQSVYYEEIIRRMCTHQSGSSSPIGVKGAIVIYAKKHCPKFLRPFAKSVKRLLKW